MRQKKSIIYINFAPYENAGRILDYLVENFSLVILFSFDFHELKNYRSNQIKIYCDGKITQEIKLFKLPTPEFLLFISLPLIALLIALQTTLYVLYFRKIYGKFDIYLTVNAFTAWVGNILRDFKIVSKTIFWVWDYYPPGETDLRIKVARFAYWKFDKNSTKFSDSVIFLNKRLEMLRKKIGVLPKNKSYPIIPIGTDPKNISFLANTTVGHMGVLKKSQGLDLLFDNLEQLSKNIPKLKIEILGSGPDEKYFKQRAKKNPNVKFYGFVEKENEVDKIIKRWSVGLATYMPERSNGAYWTDPSKIKAYIGQGVPVITTKITGFSDEIENSNAGIVIDYYDSKKFIKSIIIILKNQKKYKENAFKLAKKYYYKNIYKNLFTNLG
jgi:glycosyltransferase involved in cell wall biosynthesis